MSSDLRKRSRGPRAKQDLVQVILQIDGQMSAAVAQILKRNGVRVKGHFQNFNARAVELPASVVEELATFDEVSYISPDRELKWLGHVTTTTGAQEVRNIFGGDSDDPKLDGSGIGIAVLDSSISKSHKSFENRDGKTRIVVSRNFAGPGLLSADPYGHGTHVASLAAGSDRIASGAYTGIAPNANLINLRVLNAQGTGSVSNLLASLDWIITNRTTYNIRVVN
ncbi:MAG: S8 family serine peptidase, partial [Pyrinomonadaceae bacterium]|nr:S8 family serine peptidase [Pyrinomonadaceae bacterium]